jgi:type I restriction enzyme, S subunit
MAVKPGYAQTDIGILPDDWELVPLSELLELRNGVNAGKRAYGTGVRFINILEIITKSHLRASDIPGRITLPKPALDAYRVRRGDVVFNRTSEHQEEVGLAAVYADDEPVVFGGFVIRGRPRQAAELDADYAGYALRAPHIRRQIAARGQGAIRANIGQQDLRNVLVPRLALPEQQAIAAALGDMDALLDGLDRLISKRRDLEQAVMHQLLTGQTRLPGFGGPWATRRLGDMFTFLKTASNPRADLTTHGDVGYVHYGDIHTSSAAFLDCGTAALPRIAAARVQTATSLQDGDLVMADASEDHAGVGKCVEVKGVGGQRVVAGLHTFLLRADAELMVHGFKGYLQFIPTLHEALVRLATGISVHGLSKSTIKDVELAVPPPQEQLAIAAILADMDAERTALEHRRDKTRRLKQGMLQELLTGRTRLV